MSDKDHNSSKEPNAGFRFGTRHVQCFMAFAAMVTGVCSRTNLAVAIIAMTQKSDLNEDIPVLPWNGPMKGAVLSSFFWSYLFCQIPCGQLAEKFGPKILLITAFCLSSILIALMPLAAIYGGFYWVIIVRNILGAIQATVFPSVNCLLSKWVPQTEKGMLTNFVFSGKDFGILITMVMGGVLGSSRWGWPSIFYASAAVCLLWALAFAYVGANSPHEHNTISEGEKKYILDSLPNSLQDRKDLKTPWKALASSVHLWALIFAFLGETWGFWTIASQIPTYINSVFGNSIKQSGYLSALPYVSSFCGGYVFAFINDWLDNRKYLSRTSLRKFWNTVAHWGSALALCSLAFAGENETMAIVSLVTAATLFNASHLSCFTNHSDLAPNFSGTLMGITLAFATLSSMSAPLFAGIIVTDTKSLFLWKIVFLVAAAVLFWGNLIFIIFGSGEVQPWNFPPNTQKSNPEAAITTDKISKKDKS